MTQFRFVSCSFACVKLKRRPHILSPFETSRLFSSLLFRGHFAFFVRPSPSTFIDSAFSINRPQSVRILNSFGLGLKAESRSAISTDTKYAFRPPLLGPTDRPLTCSRALVGLLRLTFFPPASIKRKKKIFVAKRP